MSGHTLRFCLQENELSLVITQTSTLTMFSTKASMRMVTPLGFIRDSGFESESAILGSQLHVVLFCPQGPKVN